MGRPGWRESERARRRMRAFGEGVRQTLRAKGVSQEALAFNSGLDRTFVSAVERGARNPSLLSLYALADALDVDVRAFFAPESPPDDGPP
jgi:transcriptional regulator with XRE-family HTH domain